MNKDNTSKREYLRRINSYQSLYTLLQYVLCPLWAIYILCKKIVKRHK